MSKFDILTLALTLYALLIGLENLEENREQSESQQELLVYLEEHLKAQDKRIEDLRKGKE